MFDLPPNIHHIDMTHVWYDLDPERRYRLHIVIRRIDTQADRLADLVFFGPDWHSVFLAAIEWSQTYVWPPIRVTTLVRDTPVGDLNLELDLDL